MERIKGANLYADASRSERNQARKWERKISDALPRVASDYDRDSVRAGERLAAERWAYCATHALQALLSG
jgi:hypothetical protein